MHDTTPEFTEPAQTPLEVTQELPDPGSNNEPDPLADRETLDEG